MFNSYFHLRTAIYVNTTTPGNGNTIDHLKLKESSYLITNVIRLRHTLLEPRTREEGELHTRNILVSIALNHR